MDKGNTAHVICYGEVLIDCFLDQNRIGGAPLNVASRLASLGHNVSIISSVGRDTHGKNILSYLDQIGVNTSFIQSSTLNTGTVKITLDNNKNATYEICQPVAWDTIALDSSRLDMVKTSKLFIFGSLIARDTVSKETLLQLLQIAPYKVFDVNLRAPHYEIKTILALIHKADFVKMNDDELVLVSQWLSIEEKSLEECIIAVAKAINTDKICITRGDNGALLYHNNTIYEHSGYSVEVIDTVGAGDSFLAALLHQLDNNPNDPQKALVFACALGALVTSKKGANSSIKPQEIKSLTQQ